MAILTPPRATPEIDALIDLRSCFKKAPSMSVWFSALGFILTGCFINQVALAQATLAKVRAAGHLACGINREEPEYSNLDAHGNRALFDIDLCKATAVAILGPGARFDVTAFPDEVTSLKALEGGTVDLVATATPSLTNVTTFGLNFGRVMLFDYQGLMVNGTMGVHTIADLAGRKICYLTETSIELNLNNAMALRRITFNQFPFQEEGEMEAAFLTNNCAAISADSTQLAYERIAFRAKGLDYAILPDVLAKDPLASASRNSDPQWSALITSVGELLLQAEESGITAANVDSRTSDPDPVTSHLLGVSPGLGKPLALDDQWGRRTLRAVGNYGEIFARDLGPSTPMRLVRGSNRLWTDGGLMIAGPL